MIQYSFQRIGGLDLRILILAGVALLACALPTEAQLTLRRAAEEALATNHGIRAVESTLRARSAGVAAARGYLFPQITIDAAYTRMNEALELNLDPIREAMISLEVGNQGALSNLESLVSQGRPLTAAEQAVVSSQAAQQLDDMLPQFRETLKDQGFLQGIVTARQPLFTGGKILAGIRAAQAQQTAAAAALDAERDAVLAETAQRYLDVLLAAENLRVREEAKRTLTLHQGRATRLMEEGVIAQHEKMRADVALADADRAAFDARERLQIAKVALNSAIGADNPQLAVSDSLRFAEAPVTLEHALESMQRGNPSLRQLRAGTVALEQKARAKRADYFPTVYGFGMYNVFDKYMAEGLEPKWAVGIGASFTLFDGLNRTRELEAARLEASALESRTAEAERKLSLFLQSANMQMELAEEQYRQLTAALNQAEENLRLNSRRFDEGLGTSLEVIDARLSLDAVLLQRVLALHTYFSRQVDLFHVVGNVDLFLNHWERTQERDG